MNSKVKKTKKQVAIDNQVINLHSKEEFYEKIELIEKDLKSSTWRDLETRG